VQLLLTRANTAFWLGQLKDSPCGMDKSLTERDICTKFVLPAPSYRGKRPELGFLRIDE
jgi:hypothetical protein